MSFVPHDRTALGTTQTKVNGTSLVKSAVSVTIWETLIVIVGCKKQTGGAVSPTVTWGSYSMTEKVWRNNGGTQTGCGIFTLLVPVNSTEDITITYGNTVTAQLMIALSITDVGDVDVSANGIDDASTEPGSPNTPTTNFRRGFGIGFIFRNAPLEESFGTPTNNFNARRSEGTTGGARLSNVSAIEIVKKRIRKGLTPSIGLTGADSADWVLALAVFGQTRIGVHSISKWDVDRVSIIFADKITPISVDRIAFHWNRNLLRWEAYDVDVISGALIAYMNDDNSWTEV